MEKGTIEDVNTKGGDHLGLCWKLPTTEVVVTLLFSGERMFFLKIGVGSIT